MTEKTTEKNNPNAIYRIYRVRKYDGEKIYGRPTTLQGAKNSIAAAKATGDKEKYFIEEVKKEKSLEEKVDDVILKWVNDNNIRIEVDGKAYRSLISAVKTCMDIQHNDTKKHTARNKIK